MNSIRWVVMLICLVLFPGNPAMGGSTAFNDSIFNPGTLKPTDSVLKVAPGDVAPGFSLPSVSGQKVSLKSFRNKKNVLLSFIPAAWTPVCSDQWPGYNMARPLFEQYDTVVIGISTDNIPTLFAWTREMGTLWFEVASDFWPHGRVSASYGVLRSDGTAERALILIDKKGWVRFAHVSDINVRPDLKLIVDELMKLE
jgi:peroxiredoxin